MIKDGNCINCNHAVNLHARKPAQPSAPKVVSSPQAEKAKIKQEKVNQDSLKRRLQARKLGDGDECEICGQRLGDLETTRIVDEQFKRLLHDAFKNDRNLIEGTSVTRNGLLLCSCCHTKYDKKVEAADNTAEPVGRSLQIDDHGVIHLFGKAKEINYKDLDKKSVPWANLIDKDPHYPNSATLKYAFNLKIVGKGKRVRELNQDNEDEVEMAPKLKVKRRRKEQLDNRNCDISGCNRFVHIFDPYLELHLCAEHADVQEGDLV